MVKQIVTELRDYWDYDKIQQLRYGINTKSRFSHFFSNMADDMADVTMSYFTCNISLIINRKTVTHSFQHGPTPHGYTPFLYH